MIQGCCSCYTGTCLSRARISSSSAISAQTNKNECKLYFIFLDTQWWKPLEKYNQQSMQAVSGTERTRMWIYRHEILMLCCPGRVKAVVVVGGGERRWHRVPNHMVSIDVTRWGHVTAGRGNGGWGRPSMDGGNPCETRGVKWVQLHHWNMWGEWM